MYPPADPWSEPTEPGQTNPPPMYGRAPVPGPLREPTREMPAVLLPSARPPLSFEKVKNTSLRELADGWGFSAAGIFMIFIGWGVWAAAGRGTGSSPFPSVVLALLAGIVIFAVARLLGYIVLEKMWGRTRRHARWSHFFAGLFLTIAGVLFLMNTSWLVDSGDWLHDGWAWIGEQWRRR